MKIKDIWEIKPECQGEHEPGLVVILDRLIAKNPTDLVGKIVTVRIPTGEMRKLSIDEAKEHGLVNSLFFRRLTLKSLWQKRGLSPSRAVKTSDFLQC